MLAGMRICSSSHVQSAIHKSSGANAPTHSTASNQLSDEASTLLASHAAPSLIGRGSMNAVVSSAVPGMSINCGSTFFADERPEQPLSRSKNVDPQLMLMPGTADETTAFMDPRPLAGGNAYKDYESVPSDGFFDSMSYKGAFDTNLWLADWSYLGDVAAVPANIDGVPVCGSIGSQSWSGNVIMTCQVFVQDGATLTIAPGTTIYAFRMDANGLAPVLVVLPGATIEASGTAAAPITFTSDPDMTGSTARGAWGGLIIMGNAPVYGTTKEVEGITGYSYGGSDSTESSGTLSYVRVWHGGAVIGANNEINGITLAGVGSGTTADHCEVAFNVDDGFEYFGGTVNSKYLSVLFVGDDAIDTDLGFQGKIQFAYVMIGASGHHGVEMDSKMDGTPRSFPQLYGATFVGHLEAVPASISSDDQVEAILRLREGTGGEFGNLVVTNVNSNAVGLYMNDCASEVRTQENPADGGPNYLWFSANNIVYGPGGSFLLEQGCEGVKTVTQANPALRIMPTDAD